jgi:UPF0042 nucleotide-binding protein
VRIVVVTGMSGSGKSTALKALEDAGFYAIDNLPMSLLDKLVDVLHNAGGELTKLALGIDARARGGLSPTDTAELNQLALLPSLLESWRKAGYEAEVLFLDAPDQVLERRFSETRRRHPLSLTRSVKEGIALERTLLDPLRAAAARTIETGAMSSHELKREVQKLVAGPTGAAVPMGVTVVSFGFRGGVPTEADLVFDVRFLPNPFFVEALRPLTGEDEACANYVLDREETKTFFDKLLPLLEFLIPEYEHEGKAYLTIAVGCTGGQHRSVAIARRLAEWIRGKGRDVQIRHRDIRHRNG